MVLAVHAIFWGAYWALTYQYFPAFLCYRGGVGQAPQLMGQLVLGQA